MVDSLFKPHSDLVFLGDMNCCPSKSNMIHDFCDIYGLSNLITEPTCHKGDVSALLDVILVTSSHDDVIKWKHFLRYWPFAREIHQSPVNSPHKGQWRGALIFFICIWMNVWVNNRDAGDLRRHRAHHDVTVMTKVSWNRLQTWRRICHTRGGHFGELQLPKNRKDPRCLICNLFIFTQWIAIVLQKVKNDRYHKSDGIWWYSVVR